MLRFLDNNRQYEVNGRLLVLINDLMHFCEEPFATIHGGISAEKWTEYEREMIIQRNKCLYLQVGMIINEFKQFKWKEINKESEVNTQD